MDGILNKLLYGKKSLDRIVSVEVKDGSVEVFTEDSSNHVTSTFLPHYYWLLSNNPHAGHKWIKLKGDLHYKYGLKFKELHDFLRTKQSLKDKDTFSIYDNKEAFLVNSGHSYFKGMKQKDVSILTFDIETTGLDANSEDAKVLLIANTFRDHRGIQRKLFAYDEYNSQAAIIDAWSEWVRQMNPSIMCGHNIMLFDLPYLYTIAQLNGTNLHLGRDGSPIEFNKYESKFRKDQTQFLHYKRSHIYGREIIDTLFLSIRYDAAEKKYESYALKKIIDKEGLEVKDRVFYDASKIRYNYQISSEWDKIKKYAEMDGDDALALYDLMSPAYFYMTQSIPKSFQSVIQSASGSQINAIMVRAYLQEGFSIPKASQETQFVGAISIGNPGQYSNVYKVDVSSLYPSIIRQYKVYNQNKDPNAYLLMLTDHFTEDRLKNKKLAQETNDKYYDDMQSASKIFINSIYGFMGATGLNFNSPEHAATVTKLGREILQNTIKWSENKGFILTNADTDSIAFCKQNQSQFTDEERKTLLADLNNNFPEKIKFADDGYFKRFIVLKAKNYIMYDPDNANPKKRIKYKGSSLKASTLEAALQEFIKKIIDSMLHDRNDYQDIYLSYIREIDSVQDMKRWATRKSITSKTMESERLNESKIRDALEGSEYVEGDKAYFFFKSDDSLALIENFNGDYNKNKLLEKLYKSSLRFETVLPVDDLFINFKLKRNKSKLDEILQSK